MFIILFASMYVPDLTSSIPFRGIAKELNTFWRKNDKYKPSTQRNCQYFCQRDDQQKIVSPKTKTMTNTKYKPNARRNRQFVCQKDDHLWLLWIKISSDNSCIRGWNVFLEEWQICDGLFRYCFPSLTVVLLPIRQKEEGFKLLFVSMAALGNRPLQTGSLYCLAFPPTKGRRLSKTLKLPPACVWVQDMSKKYIAPPDGHSDMRLGSRHEYIALSRQIDSHCVIVWLSLLLLLTKAAVCEETSLKLR